MSKILWLYLIVVCISSSSMAVALVGFSKTGNWMYVVLMVIMFIVVAFCFARLYEGLDDN